MLTMDDLLPTCVKCEGTGKLDNPLVDNNRGSFGTHLVWASPIDCDICQGHGVMPSETGKVFIEFIKRAKSKGLI